MAGTHGTYPSLVPGWASDSEEVSNFLNQLLHDSSSSCMASKIKTLPSPWISSNVEGSQEDPQWFGQFGSESGSDNLLKIGKSLAASNNDSSSSFIFSDPYGYLKADVKDVAENEFFATGVEDSYAVTSLKENRISTENNSSDFICYVVKNKEGGSELPSKPVPPRSSSKRSRAADVHNMSEKRRRSRINEKMKALQNLIPNSSKADKASMLDDAIEYLKQLQLQVQMLTMRNGLSLHAMCLPGALQPVMSPQNEFTLDKGNGIQKSSSGIASSANAETLVQPFIKHSISPNQSGVTPSVTYITTSGLVHHNCFQIR